MIFDVQKRETFSLRSEILYSVFTHLIDLIVRAREGKEEKYFFSFAGLLFMRLKCCIR